MADLVNIWSFPKVMPASLTKADAREAFLVATSKTLMKQVVNPASGLRRSIRHLSGFCYMLADIS